jgi:hypothetical protein
MPKVPRDTPEEIAHAVFMGGRIKIETAIEVLRLIEQKTDYRAHLAIEVNTGALLKTLDNEDDAQETLSRLRSAPDKKK